MPGGIEICILENVARRGTIHSAFAAALGFILCFKSCLVKDRGGERPHRSLIRLSVVDLTRFTLTHDVLVL